MQKITVLGSTGSVGKNTLDVIARHRDRFEVFALGAATQVDAIFQQCIDFAPQFAVMASAEPGRRLQEKIKQNRLLTAVLWGPDAMQSIASDPAVDVVMAAIVGAAGLAPCLAAARSGKRLLLANKEALVVGGDVFMRAVEEGGAILLPIDSEHSAIFQSLPDDPKTWATRVEKIILTASGGPFRKRDPATLFQVTPEEACAHPNWSMGQKISVDSATMMNKVLEVIEARYLFGIAPCQIDVVVHPQSVVHSMVQYHDTSIVAQLGVADMRVPIAYGLSWPARISSGAQPLNFASLGALTFESVDAAKFPGMGLAWETLEAPFGTTAVLNAANETAVRAFIDRRVRFDQIHHINIATLAAVSISKPGSLDDLLELDERVRHVASSIVSQLQL